MERLTERITDKRTREVLAYRAKCHKDVEAVQKLGRLEDSEEQGKLLKMPCAVGECVYFIKMGYTFGEIGDKSEVWHRIDKTAFSIDMINDFGKTVFLTREEAEAALKELKIKETRK